MDALIVDCGIGNIKSVQRMFEAVDARAEIVSDSAAITGAPRIVLPGVGAFDAGMRALEEGGWVEPLKVLAFEERVPVLGICLGMQLLCRRSEEGAKPGLGWIEADVVKLQTGGDRRIKIPHMGWAITPPSRPNPLITDEEEQRFYYVHSYHVVCDDPADVLATASYGQEFTSAVGHRNIFGVQFHPEKSHRFGKELLRRFVELAC